MIIVGAAFAALGVGLYIRGEHRWSSLLAAMAIALPLLAAVKLPRPGAWKEPDADPGGTRARSGGRSPRRVARWGGGVGSFQFFAVDGALALAKGDLFLATASKDPSG